MVVLDALLLALTLLAVVLWAGLSLHIVRVERRRAEAQQIVGVALELLERPDVKALSLWEQVSRLRPLLKRASRELIMRAAAGRETPDQAFDTLYGYFTERWGDDLLVDDASQHKSARDKWRRMTALRILHRANHPDAMQMLEQAVTQDDTDVASVALSLLGPSSDPHAVEILL